MKRTLSKMALLPIILFAVTILFACNGNQKKDRTEEINLIVSSQPAEYYTFTSERPFKGINVRESGSDSWTPMSLNAIEGFDYEEGYEYDLKVLKTYLANPPMDAANYRYKLIKILSQVKK